MEVLLTRRTKVSLQLLQLNLPWFLVEVLLTRRTKVFLQLNLQWFLVEVLLTRRTKVSQLLQRKLLWLLQIVLSPIRLL